MQSFDVHTSSDLKKNAFDDDQEAKLCQNYSDMSHNHVILHAKHNMCLAAWLSAFKAQTWKDKQWESHCQAGFPS